MAGVFGGHAFSNEPMSFDARAHATHHSWPSASPGFGPISEDSTTAKQIATLQAKLNKKLGPEYVSQRPGPGGGPKLTYAEGWKIINLANEVFGFNGWSSSIVSVTTDFVDYNEESKRFNVGVTAIVRVTLRDGAYHEDVGYGMLENSKSKAGALDKCKKEAITDALKRTLRNFGNLLGNCLYDKSYAQEVVKIKVPPVKFDKNELHRRPEFTECALDTPQSAPRVQPATAEIASPKHGEPLVKVEQDARLPETPITYVPRHLRQEVVSAQQSRMQGHTPARTPAMPQNKVPLHPQAQASTSGSGSNTIAAPKTNGLATPIQTPVPARRPPPPRAPPMPVVTTSPLAQTRNASERSVTFSEPVSADDIGQGCGGEDDEDSFPLSTQDGEFFAMVDLGDGDLGRPIDFEEGIAGASNVDGSALGLEVESTEQPVVAQPPSRFQVRERTGSGSSSGVPTKTNEQKGAHVQPFLKPTVSTSNPTLHCNASGGQPQPPSGAQNIAISSSASSANAGSPAPDVKRFRPASTSMGGFHFPADTKSPIQQDQQQPTRTLKPTTLFARTTSATPGPANVLKRTAEEMMSHKAPSSSTRPVPIQGMGLAQREQQQNASARRPSDHGEGNDPKRIKR